MKFLIVEDHPPMRGMLKSLIADLATGIHECADGHSAVTCYAAQQPDWVLMDIELPGQDGISATRQIKATWPQANILIVTSYDEPELRRAAQAVGVCGYVLKENLLELHQWLAVTKAHGTSTSTILPAAEKGTPQ